MGKQITEMLKGTLEGIVLRSCRFSPPTATRSQHGCAIRASRTSQKAPSMPYSSGSNERTRGRGEDPVRQGSTAQGVLAQCPRTGVPGGVLEDVALPRWTARTASRRREIEMVTGRTDQKKRYRQYKARHTTASRGLPNSDRCTGAVHGVLRSGNGGHAAANAGGPRRPLRASRGERDLGPWDRRR